MIAFGEIVSSESYAANPGSIRNTYELSSRIRDGKWDLVVRREVLLAVSPQLILRRSWPGVGDEKT